MLKRYWFKCDWTLLIPVFILLVIGVLMMFSTSSIVGFSNYNDAYFFIKRHLIYLGLGLVALGVGLVVPHQFYRKKISLLFLFMVALLGITLSPLGVKIGGAQRWLNLGVLQFQPVEVAKFVVVIFIATGLNRSKEYLSSFFKGCFPMLLITSIPLGLLVLQPDLGNTGMILVVMFTLFFLSQMPIKHILTLVSMAIAVLTGVILTHAYQLQRITSFLNPWEDPLGKNYHMVQSLTAIGSGGFWGLGLGESKLKYFYLPLQYSDFIFSIICEEGGFIFASIIVCLYVSILLKTFHIVKNAAEPYSFFLGMGCCFLVCFQAFINIVVVIGLFPVTGIPLTFISFGGTSLITSLFYIGVILNISNSIVLKEYGINK
ncbi:stage V sporulation protein E [Candidatus Marinamargulisbacteria bacterium SCGC AG-343-D04]|nr:stage V sporulation protein E [Candidatus Marinamargulisbacteria bacterium SCGC AG-343-D04]